MMSHNDRDESWVHWFCMLKGHEYFCEVERSYIEDAFNLYGLRQFVPNFNVSLDVILDRVDLADESDEREAQQHAEILYGLIHARYIITTHGLNEMKKKYQRGEFGRCPRHGCRDANMAQHRVLPLGLRDEPTFRRIPQGLNNRSLAEHMLNPENTVKVYCPWCADVYHVPQAGEGGGDLPPIDGAYFGTTFPHLFFLTFEHLKPKKSEWLASRESYVPRVFGFRIYTPRQQGDGDETSRITESSNQSRRADATDAPPEVSQVPP